VRAERERNADFDRALREAQFSLRESEGKLQTIFGQQATAQRELNRIEKDRAQCAEQVEAAPADVMEENLQAALETRQEKEMALADCRNTLEAATNALRGLEEQRMKIEQGLEPLRVRIGDLKLKEQAAALNTEQFAQQLLEAGADEAALEPELGNVRPAGLQGEITRLGNAIAELGAVNLAALEELETASERKGYLDMQAADLTEAMETLENAIRRIDRETRDLLKSTFDTVNGHFGQLFPGAVRRRSRRAGDDRRGNPRCRRAGDRPAAGEKEFDHPFALRRRKGADGNCAGFFDVPAQPGAVLSARRGRCAAG
jgi:chromosome segregation protein